MLSMFCWLLLKVVEVVLFIIWVYVVISSVVLYNSSGCVNFIICYFFVLKVFG